MNIKNTSELGVGWRWISETIYYSGTVGYFINLPPMSGYEDFFKFRANLRQWYNWLVSADSFQKNLGSFWYSGMILKNTKNLGQVEMDKHDH